MSDTQENFDFRTDVRNVLTSRPDVAEVRAREALRVDPADADAVAVLAEALLQQNRIMEAQWQLQRCLALKPAFSAARRRYAVLLLRSSPAGALTHAEILLREDPANPQYRDLKATALAELGMLDEAIAIYGALTADHHPVPETWVRYGNVLSICGRMDAAVAAYRKAIALRPSLGEAYFSLANLKTFRFDEADIEAMRQCLQDSHLRRADGVALHFALGKALEDAGEYQEAFAQYEKGNALHRATLNYDAGATAAFLNSCKDVFTKEFLTARAGGLATGGPIFVVGLPRSGSTLIEQVLASHSAIEGTRELKAVIAMATGIGAHHPAGYPLALRDLPKQQFTAMGEEYLKRTQPFRKLGRQFFVDKMPNNFAHVGLIHLMLPKAKIIDVRRNALDCCFSNFTQHFAQGQPFAYSLSDMARYYSGYVDLMAHFDSVLPGKIHRVIYEQFVENPEAESRRLFAHLGLPFEEHCLHFYENDRPVRSASSEQVRRPIFREGVDRWRKFEPWLQPLKEALTVGAA